MIKFLEWLGVCNEDGKFSLTNFIVFLFVGLTAFRFALAGAHIEAGSFTWKIESLDISSTLPLLFGLLNYGHKRIITTETATNSVSKSTEIK